LRPSVPGKRENAAKDVRKWERVIMESEKDSEPRNHAKNTKLKNRRSENPKHLTLPLDFALFA
jgi:hypothetical protein